MPCFIYDFFTCFEVVGVVGVVLFVVLRGGVCHSVCVCVCVCVCRALPPAPLLFVVAVVF